MSRLRANQITNKTANGAPTVQNGLIVTGVCTATSFVGSGTALTGIDAATLNFVIQQRQKQIIQVLLLLVFLLLLLLFSVVT